MYSQKKAKSKILLLHNLSRLRESDGVGAHSQGNAEADFVGVLYQEFSQQCYEGHFLSKIQNVSVTGMLNQKSGESFSISRPNILQGSKQKKQ